MWALKIGGSILDAALVDTPVAARDAVRREIGASITAKIAVDLMAELKRQPGCLLLVPGGGHYADAVRAAQVAEGFDDDTAHVRALAAMDTCAAELADLIGATARVVHHLSDARATAARGFTPVWAPHADLANDHTIPRNWSLTSDSIAAVAARRLDLDGVCLLKSCAVPAGASAADLAAAGVVDAEWPRISCTLNSCVLGPEVWAPPGGLRNALGGMHLATPSR